MEPYGGLVEDGKEELQKKDAREQTKKENKMSEKSTKLERTKERKKKYTQLCAFMPSERVARVFPDAFGSNRSLLA